MKTILQLKSFVRSEMELQLEDYVIIAATTIGFISLSKHLIVFSIWVYKMFLRRPKNLLDYGSWAVVTGSTDGIGKALALELASKGLNVVCVGRSPAKLDATAHEIRQRCGPNVEVRNLVVDFDRFSQDEIRSALDEGMAGIDIGVVVNNAGVMYLSPRFFHETSEELMERVIRVNAEAAVWVTKAVIPAMMKKKKGAILNIGSGSSLVASYPFFALYGATKCFMDMFSRSISLEYRQHGIDIQCQVPLYIATKMTMMKPSLFAPSPEMYGRASVRWIGYDCVCSPFWCHSMLTLAVLSIPDAIFNWFIMQVYGGLHLSVLGNINPILNWGVTQVFGGFRTRALENINRFSSD